MNEQDPATLLELRRLADAVDIHSHPLPGIDDGATSLEASLNMARIAARYGTSLMVATPHRYYGGRENTPDLLRRLTAQVNAALRETRFGHRIRLLPGQEIPLTLQTAEELQRGETLTLGDTGLSVLVEPPFDHLPEWTARALEKITNAGYRPILAHPERNAVVQQTPTLARDFVRAGAALQLTAMSVTGDNGRRALSAALWILEEGLAGMIASDSHSPAWRPPNMRSAYHALRERYGVSAARLLCVETPRALVLAGRAHKSG